MIPTGEWTRNETKRNETERNRGLMEFFSFSSNRVEFKAEGFWVQVRRRESRLKSVIFPFPGPEIDREDCARVRGGSTCPPPPPPLRPRGATELGRVAALAHARTHARTLTRSLARSPVRHASLNNGINRLLPSY